ncbi:MAG: glycosyltransferase family 2 protein [Elusimicrobia bacterium]|jgi:glycosyltransferase involved in cell wall biosynthesis|nr:glycosyltransferase family 2 protein [Elusimicrobiota bacterium]
MNNITAIVVTYNEEKNIKECLGGLKFADEIIVVDSHSEDRTRQIATAAGAKVIKSNVNYPEYNKNIGIDKAENKWVFIIDADERVSPPLASEIKEKVKSDKYAGYRLYRKNFFLSKEIKHCGWEKDSVVRLFKKEKGRYPDKRVHGVLVLEGREGRLKEKLGHYSYRNVSDYFEKVNRYTLWNARDSKGKKVTGGKLFFNPLFRFIKMYFLRLGFLDGIHGFVLSVTASFSVFIKYLRIYLDE